MRQYIGARYVPKFFDNNGSTDWIPGVAYEPLTIVTHFGNSFTSKKPVPVGIDILNNDYWANTGNYNAQIEEYRQDVEAYKAEVSPLINKKYLFFSDSFGEVPVGETWIDYIAGYLGLSASDYYKSVEGGSGFNHAGNNTGYKFEQRLVAFANTLTTEQKEEITDIVIVGGTNDCSDDNSVNGLGAAMRSFFNTCKPIFPNATFSVFFAASLFIPASDALKASRLRKRTVRQSYATVCGEYSKVKIYPLADMSINWTHLYSDSVHLVNVGSLALARYVLRALNGNAAFAPYDVDYNGFKFKGMGTDMITVQLPGFITNKTIPGKGAITLAAYDSSNPLPFCPSSDCRIQIAMPMALTIQNGVQVWTSDLCVQINSAGTIELYNMSDSSITFTECASGPSAILIDAVEM